ncbi:MAG: hypothetical protein NC305_00675 [Lachnospiraceae bacterium]|nr:hypothetical protein [Butyrivibrio sp.]MCM1409050.1 hypothetical protein [Lachnospiraceae bacterium]
MHKKEFLRKLGLSEMTMAEFVFSQTGYIRRWVWAVSVLAFLTALAGALLLSADMIWAISAFTPLLALTLLSESGRSENYKMAELEMATRFSLRSVLLARTGILGMENLALLCLLIPLGLRNNTFSPLQAGAYILTPFLLTTFTGLWIVRRSEGREGMYLCVGIAVCVSVSVFFFHRTVPQIYGRNHLAWWIAGALLLCMGTVRQYCDILERRST